MEAVGVGVVELGEDVQGVLPGGAGGGGVAAGVVSVTEVGEGGGFLVAVAEAAWALPSARSDLRIWLARSTSRLPSSCQTVRGSWAYPPGPSLAGRNRSLSSGVCEVRDDVGRRAAGGRYEPIVLPDDAWRDRAVLDACEGLDANRLLTLANRKYGVSQERLGHFIGVIDAVEVNKRINGRKPGKVESLHRWKAIADALNMPDHARALIGLAAAGVTGAGPMLRRVRPAVAGSGVSPGVGRIDSELEALELVRRVEASDLGGATLEGLYSVVQQLCRDYPSVAANELRDHTRGYLSHIMRLLDGRTTLAQHRELLVDAGWLAALLSCLHYDLGESGPAELYRRVTRQLGEQADHGEIVAWSWEIAAWFALVEGRYRDAVSLSEAGLERAGTTSAAVQLTVQAGRGYARMEDNQAKNMLETGRKILSHLPAPEHPQHHFVFDGSKYEFYVATILTWLGSDDAVAEEYAREVVAQCQDTDGGILWPTRLGTTRLNLGLIATRRGDLEEVVANAEAALSLERRSAEFLPRALELRAELEARYPKERRTGELREMLALDAGASRSRKEPSAHSPSVERHPTPGPRVAGAPASATDCGRRASPPRHH